MDTELGQLSSAPASPKKGRRIRKKLTEKQLLGMYFADSAGPGTDVVEECAQNHVYLSAKERATLETKYTRPKNQHQEQYVDMLKSKSKKIVVATGPAGTGKTLFATEYGVRGFLNGTVEKLIFTRPSVSVDEDLGYLPGTLEDKMAPWIRPIYDILYQHMSAKDVAAHLEEKTIEIAPLGFMRGRTFKNAWIVADEMQNSTVGQMKMLLTRLGENSRVVITGDLEQFDRVGGTVGAGGTALQFADQINGLADFLEKFKGKRSSSITSMEFERTDVLREEVVKEVLEIYGTSTVPAYSGNDTDTDLI